MSRAGRIGVFKTLLGIGLYLLALHFGTLAAESLGLTHIVLESGISAGKASQIQLQEWEEETPVGFCFWGEKPNQALTCRETGKSAQVTQVLLAGNPELMGAGPLGWQSGCLVDAQTAYDLFGTTQVGGQILWTDGMQYPVLGITDALRPTMILMAEEEDSLDRLILSVPGEAGSRAASSCLIRWGLQGRTLNPGFLWSLVKNFLLLFPGILSVLVCSCLARGWREMGDLFRRKQWLCLCRILLACVIFGGSVWLLLSRVTIPANMFPTKWSDFSFWGRWWESEKENILAMLLTPMEDGRLQMLWNMVKSMTANAAACLAVLWPIRERQYANSAD